MPEKEVGARIKRRRKELNMTLQDIADRVHLARSTIQRYEAGTIGQMKMPVLYSIASVLDVSPEWLIGKVDAAPFSFPVNVVPMPRMSSIPLVGEIACGTPIMADENVEEYVSVPEHVHADFALRCKGDSMIGARIHDGDVVYIRQQPEVPNGMIAAVRIGTEATLKRVYRNGSSLILQPENSAYAPLVYSGEQLQDVAILGRAVAFTSTI